MLINKVNWSIHPANSSGPEARRPCGVQMTCKDGLLVTTFGKAQKTKVPPQGSRTDPPLVTEDAGVLLCPDLLGKPTGRPKGARGLLVISGVLEDTNLGDTSGGTTSCGVLVGASAQVNPAGPSGPPFAVVRGITPAGWLTEGALVK